MEYVSVKEAAERLSCTEQMVRQGIKQGVFTFGIAVEMGRDGRRSKYYIYKKAFERYVADKE
jgi:hypothetical protein